MKVLSLFKAYALKTALIVALAGTTLVSTIFYMEKEELKTEQQLLMDTISNNSFYLVAYDSLLTYRDYQLDSLELLLKKKPTEKIVYKTRENYNFIINDSIIDLNKLPWATPNGKYYYYKYDSTYLSASVTIRYIDNAPGWVKSSAYYWKHRPDK